MNDTKPNENLDFPAGIKNLSPAQLEAAALHLRQELIMQVAQSGGHFASNLGVVELTLALHYCFDTPHDKLVWDVGHQSYVHKMLTGRRAQLPTIRQKGGLCGFPRRDESPYDAFGAGHAGTSISAALGMALAHRAEGDERRIVAIIGDGAMTSGMAFEALNHAGSLELDNLIVVLNDNQMSISPNVGALKWYFSRTLTSPRATRARNAIKRLFREGRFPAWLFRIMDRIEGATQGFISGPARLFEAFGFRYVGPIDGHQLPELVRAFENAKAQRAPTLVHVCTIKGKGHPAAEDDPVKWHGISPARAGEHGAGHNAESYTEVFGSTLRQLGRKEPRLIAVTAAMAKGTGLEPFQEAYPQRFFDVGICEEHAVTMAAGLAAEGFKPVCAIYSSFIQRAVDQIMHDVCLQKLPVVFAVDRAGLVGSDGPTHHGAFDIAMLRTLPEIVLMSPKDGPELERMLAFALNAGCPVVVRYPREAAQVIPGAEESEAIALGKAEVITTGTDILFICYGPVVAEALEAANKLERELGLSSTVVNARFAKSLDAELLAELIPRHSFVATVEDHAIAGGFGSAVLEHIHANAVKPRAGLMRFGIADKFVPHATQKEQRHDNGFDAPAIFEYCAKIFSGRRRAA